jgi:hypothetical protein
VSLTIPSGAQLLLSTHPLTLDADGLIELPALSGGLLRISGL